MERKIEIGKTYNAKTVLDLGVAPMPLEQLQAFHTLNYKFVGRAVAPIAAGAEIVLYSTTDGWFAAPIDDFLALD